MQRADPLARAQHLAAEAVELCAALGHSVAAAHIQLGLDLISTDPSAARHLREERSPWGASEEPELP